MTWWQLDFVRKNRVAEGVHFGGKLGDGDTRNSHGQPVRQTRNQRHVQVGRRNLAAGVEDLGKSWRGFVGRAVSSAKGRGSAVSRDANQTNCRWGHSPMEGPNLW